MSARSHSSLLRICRADFKASFAIMLEYRATVFLWMLAGITPLIMMFVWRHLAAGTSIAGRGPEEFSCYFLVAFLTMQCCQVWVVWNVDYYVRSGTYAIQLLRPFDPWFTELIDNIAANCLRFPMNVVIVAVGLTLTGSWHLIGLARLPLFFLAVALSWQIMFNLNYALALLGLWTERIKAIDGWIYIMVYTLGGVLFPLDLLSPSVQSAIAWTPFPWMINFPVALLTGSADPLRGYAMQAFWVGIAVLSHRILWAHGLKRFGAVGG